MKSPYEDIINLPHHVSSTRPQMAMIDRAAQFSPFAALTGYDAAITETGRLTEEFVELDESRKCVLDEKLREASGRIPERLEISVTYFVPDVKKNGGRYVTVNGRLKRIDEYARELVLETGEQVSIERIYDLHILSSSNHC